MRVLVAGPARVELREIVRHIAADNPTAARRLADDVFARCQTLATAPLKGPVVGTRSGVEVRRLVHGAYLIFYSVGGDLVRIHRIVHGARAPHGFLRNLDLS